MPFGTLGKNAQWNTHFYHMGFIHSLKLINYGAKYNLLRRHMAQNDKLWIKKKGQFCPLDLPFEFGFGGWVNRAKQSTTI